MKPAEVRVYWHYRGVSGTVLDKSYAHQEEADGPWELSHYYWSAGNNACDCNRIGIIGEATLPAEKFPELYHLKGDMYGDGSGPVDETHVRCGGHIAISRVEPLDPMIPALELNEEEDSDER